MNTWLCIVCGFVYDEEKGLPEAGIAPPHGLGRCPCRFYLPRLRG